MTRCTAPDTKEEMFDDIGFALKGVKKSDKTKGFGMGYMITDPMDYIAVKDGISSSTEAFYAELEDLPETRPERVLVKADGGRVTITAGVDAVRAEEDD